MLIYNTTYHVTTADARNFVIWLNECFSLQWEVEDSAALHRWHTRQGARLNEEMLKIFKDKVIGFPTLMEVIK